MIKFPPRRPAAATLAFMLLAGCGSLNVFDTSNNIDYKSAKKNPTLEVPPDLTQLARENRYSMPQAAGSATLSTYNSERGAEAQPTGTTGVLPTVENLRIERQGSQRWLVVNQPPEKVYPLVKEFWQDLGFVVQLDMPEAGIVETDWAENRAKIPQDGIRNLVGKVLDNVYSSGERDKFRTRLEPSADGGTEVFISHRGVQEVLVGTEKERAVWTPRASSPELEAEFLRRFMVRLGMESEQAKSAVAASTEAQPKAQLEGNVVSVKEPFDRAWRRVGLALDRVGFTVEDRNRQEGLYFVRYIDPVADAEVKSEKGFLGRLFSWGDSDKPKASGQYRITVKGEGEATQVSVQDKDGAAGPSDTRSKILALLYEQLK